MIEDMYSVFARINDIKKRFGLMRYNRATGNGNTKFQQEVDRAIEQRRNDDAMDTKKKIQKRYTISEVKDIAKYYAKLKGVPPSLVDAVIRAESGYNQYAVSPKGAKGLMQLMPAVIREMGIRDPFNPEENIRGGVTHMKRLLQKYGWDYKKALAAYNAGENAVDLKNGIPEYRETVEYVKRVIQSYLKNNE